MTYEEKARAYDEAMERAKEYHNSARTCFDIDGLKYIFPELAESEDEKIRKQLVDMFKEERKSITDCITTEYDDTDIEDKNRKEWFDKVISWLEKQGELKRIEEVNGEDYGIDSLWHAVSILEITLGKVEGYQSDDGILEHKAAITAVKKMIEILK